MNRHQPHRFSWRAIALAALILCITLTGWRIEALISAAPPPELTTCILLADRDEVVAGDPVTLTWHIDGQYVGASLKVKNGPVLKEITKKEADGSFKVNPKEDTTYSITGTGKGAPDNCRIFFCDVTIKVRKCIITADLERTKKPGDEVELRWKLVAPAGSEVTIKDDSGPVKNDAGLESSVKVKPGKKTIYTLTWRKPGEKINQVGCSVTVLVGDPPSCTLDTDPSRAEGKNISMIWTSNNAVSGDLFVWNGRSYDRVPGFKFAPDGEIEVRAPKKIGYYSLAVANATGESTNCQVQVELGCVLKAQPHKVAKPTDAVQLAWKAPGTAKRDLQPGVGPVDASGTKVVKPDKTTVYTLKVTPPGQTPSCSACVTVPGGGVKEGGSKTLDIRPLPQQTAVWCWLAVGEMVFKHYGVKQVNPVSYQCGIVGSVFPVWCGADCRNCIVGAGTPNNITKILEEYPVKAGAAALKSRALTRSLTEQEVKSEIDADRPIIAGISPDRAAPRKPTQHVALIVGYVEADGEMYLVINDPFPFDQAKVPNPYMAAGGQNNHDGSYCISYKAFRDRLVWLDTFDQIKK